MKRKEKDKQKLKSKNRANENDIDPKTAYTLRILTMRNWSYRMYYICLELKVAKENQELHLLLTFLTFWFSIGLGFVVGHNICVLCMHLSRMLFVGGGGAAPFFFLEIAFYIGALKCHFKTKESEPMQYFIQFGWIHTHTHSDSHSQCLCGMLNHSFRFVFHSEFRICSRHKCSR